MGSSSYAPKYYNPNWGQYSRKRRLWEADQKRKQKVKDSKPNKSNIEKNNVVIRCSY